jgi:aryl-alcohol dehydrogenase-like predicted oxidoreductase
LAPDAETTPEGFVILGRSNLEEWMIYKKISARDGDGLTVSAVGIGCNAFGGRTDAAETAAIIDRAIDAGINFIDTANSYGDGLSEEYIGRALGPRRADVVLATKFGMREGASAEAIEKSIDESLKRLGTDYIDLYQLHTPDANTALEETLAALNRLVRAGKVRFIGCSNFSGRQLEAALALSADMKVAAFVTAQNPYNLLARDIEGGLLPVCRGHGIGILPYYPIQRGLLTGKYKRGETPPEDTRLGRGGGDTRFLNDASFDAIDALKAYAAAQGHSILELAMSWLASQPVVASVIAGVSKADQIESNAKAAGWALTPDDFAAIDQIAAPPAPASTTA